MRTSALIALTLAKRRMTAPLVVEHLDVVEQLHLRVAEAFEAIGALALYRREEAFHDGIVVAVATSAHAQVMPRASSSRCVRAALIGVT